MEPAMSIFKGVSVMDENNIGEDGGEQVLEVHGIRVIPGVIKFNGAFVGQTYRTHFSLQNVANKIVNVKICKPYSWAFRMNDVGKEFQLSPGLKISRMITFVCVQDSVFESTLPIQIEDQQLHLPIVVSKGETMIRVTPTVLDFGMLDLGCPFVTRCLRITNVGNCTSKFAIDLGPNHLDLFASPKKGRLAPKSTINVRVEMSGFYPGEFSDEFWVKCEPPQRVRVEVTILVPHLQACHPNTTEDFTLIDFKPTYYGCERFETLILRNVSSFQSMFVTMAELDSARLITLAEAEKNIAGYRNFSVQPIDGRLGPFEGRIFTVKFIPKIDPLPEQGWSHQQQTSLTTDRFIFVRIHRVDVIMKMPESLVDRTLAREDNKGENTAEMHVRTTSSVTQYPPLMDEGRNNMADKVDDNLKLTDDVSGAVRLCLYGAAVHPHIAVVPDCLYFGSVTLGECSTRVLTLENPSNLLPIGFSHTRIPYVDVTPKEGVLMPNKSIQLKVTLHASSTGIVQKHLRVNLLSHSDMTEKKGLKIIGREIVALQYEIVAKAKRPVPKIHRGITPAVTHEVGEHSEMVTYQAVVSGRVEIPELARRLIKGGARVWKLHPDAKVAFPNDMPHSLRPKSTDKAVVSIYTGKRRYVPPLEKKYAYTSKEIVERNKMKAAYAEFTSVTGNNIKEALKKREVPPPDEYSVSNSNYWACMKDWQLIRPQKLTWTKSTLRCGYMVKESEVDLSRSPFIIPITPMHLYNIQLMPQTIDFGMIPENTKCVEKLVVENRNCFPVSVKLLAPAGSAVALPPGEIVVDRFSKSKQNIYLHLDLLGKYYSNISYVINTFHKYEIKVTANVVQRVLYLNPKEVTFGATKPYDIFQDESIPIQIMNPLKVPTKFLWKVPPSCPYRVEPMKGVVKGHDYLKCCVYFTGSHRSGHHNLSVAVFLQLVTHKGSVVRLKCLYRSLTQCSVSLLLEKMNVGPLPLGIKTTRSAIIFNSGRQDVTYSTQNQTTPPGVRVRPVTNIVKAKSCSLININFSVEAVQALDFYLIIDIQSLASLKLHIIGYVPYPKIHFSPHNVLIRSVECSSYCNIPIVASNKAPTQAIVQFETANFTQFNVSLSSDPIDPGIDPAGIVMEPGKSTTMYLHFAPICIASYQFYLPMKINHIIGYPVIENKNSIKTETYIKQGTSDVSKKWAKRLCKKKPICELTTPEYIDTIKVQCTVAEQKISFSQTEFNFVQTSSLSEKAPQGIVIYNHTGPPLKVALTLNALHNSPFSMTSPSGVEGVKDTICQDNPIPVCVFNVDKSIDFTITFNPSKPSSWVIDVAVYVLPETPNLRPYKHIRLSGVFHISTLFCQYLQVYLLPTPLGVPSEKKIVIIASHQERDTKLDARTEPNCPQLSATARIDFDYPNGSNIPACRDKFIIPVTIKFTSKRVTSFRTFVNFSDGCGGNARIELFVSADSSLLTTYVYKFLFAGKRSIGDEATSVKSHKLNKASIRRVSSAYEYENADPGKDKEETRICDCPSYCPCLKEEGTNEEVNPNVAAANEEEEFPRFPLSFDTTFGQFMLRTLKLVEDWLFEQGFQGSYRFKVGQHIAYSKTFGEALSSRSKTPCLKDVKSLVDLIVNLYGKEFLPRPVPKFVQCINKT